VKRNITCFIERRLKLKVNETKSAVARPAERKFLGFSFTRDRKRRIAAQALVRFKRKIREITARTRGISIEQIARNSPPTYAGGRATSAFARRPQC